MVKFTLVDGVAMNLAHPSTFNIPSTEEKNKIVSGDFVKAGFVDGFAPTEHMWLKVIDVEHDDAGKVTLMIGSLENDPILFTGLKFGYRVIIKSDNVLSIMS